MRKYELICLGSFFVSFKDLRGVARVDEVYFIILNSGFSVRESTSRVLNKLNVPLFLLPRRIPRGDRLN